MPITVIALRMVFVHAWTIGDASSCLSSQLLYQVHFVCSMSSGIITPPQLDIVIRCVANEEKSLWSLLPLVLISCLYHLHHSCVVPLSSHVGSYFGNCVEFETIRTFPVIRNCTTLHCINY
jgi:hypothetical protein